jgi:hypothetical protein
MIKRFREYLVNGDVRKVSRDPAEAESLLRHAEQREAHIAGKVPTEDNSTFIFEDVYDALREAALALVALRGYKTYSHEAIIAYLREFHALDEGDVSTLDRYRVLRNNSVYRGEFVSMDTCKEALRFLASFLPVLKKEFTRLQATGAR